MTIRWWRWPPPDRRRPELANQRSYKPTVRVADLPAWRQGLFQAQLTMWRAANEYERAISRNVAYGIPVPTETVQAWDRAREDWLPWLRMLREPAAEPTITTTPARKGYL